MGKHKQNILRNISPSKQASLYLHKVSISFPATLLLASQPFFPSHFSSTVGPGATRGLRVPKNLHVTFVSPKT